MGANLECSVLGCHTRSNQGLHFYRFPCHNSQINSIWEQRICQSAKIDFDILNDRVCELHFNYRCKTGNECGLEEGSLPTLYLPGFGNDFSSGNAHFQFSADRVQEQSYTISIDTLSYHCRFCLCRGLLYEIEASTYRSKSFSSLIDLPPNVLPDNTHPNACLSCLKSIVIAHQLSMAVEHSNAILQQLLQHPKQSKLVSNTNFFDIKSELAFCNLILANSLVIKLEIEIEDKSFAIKGEYTNDPSAEVIPDANEDSVSCVVLENTDDNVEVMVPNNSDDSCAKDRQLDNEQVPESTNKAKNKPTYKCDLCKFTTDYKAFLSTHKNLHLTGNAKGQFYCLKCEKDFLLRRHFLRHNTIVHADDFICKICEEPHASATKLAVHYTEHHHFQCDISSRVLRSGHRAYMLDHKQGMATFTTIYKNTHWNVNDGVYICPMCEWKTPSPNSFNTHLGKHEQSEKDSSIGSQEFETLKTDAVRNADGRYRCTECPKAFRNKHDFIRHVRIHSNERPYKCTECPKAFSQKSILNTHRRIHTNERPYKCTECPKTFIDNSAFNIHKRIHTNERPYKCTECSKTFSHKSNLSTHMRIHTNEKPYQCTECCKTFSNVTNAIVHKRKHTNERPYKCSDCPKSFRQRGHLNRHNRIHTNEKPYKCTKCPKAFSQKCSLDIHQRIHTNERPYKCTECPKTFRHKSALNTHRRIHTNERPYQCAECSKSFSDISSFIVHKRKHTNERPYECSECPKTFRHKSHFSVHKRIHTNERPYKCTKCPKAFSQKCSLDIHQRTHTNERPYKCTECSKTFRQKGSLDIHMRTHTNERPYKCAECLKTFSHKSGLNTHKCIHTNE